MKKHLYEAPYGPGDRWPGQNMHEDGVDAYFVPVGLWVRANSPEKAEGIATALLDEYEQIDTGEAGTSAWAS